MAIIRMHIALTIYAISDQLKIEIEKKGGAHSLCKKI